MMAPSRGRSLRSPRKQPLSPVARTESSEARDPARYIQPEWNDRPPLSLNNTVLPRRLRLYFDDLKPLLPPLSHRAAKECGQMGVSPHVEWKPPARLRDAGAYTCLAWAACEPVEPVGFVEE